VEQKQYDNSRPTIPMDIARSVKVEAGHQCAIKACPEHTYVEIHHINENREDNRIENLILLCDKHHKMAHAGVIDRKSLHEYKKLLQVPNVGTLLERLEKLESMLAVPGVIPSTSGTPDRSINLVLEEAALLRNKLRGTPEGNAIAQQMFTLIRKYGNKMGVESVDLMVRRDETYSRTGLSGLGILYDEFFVHTKALNLVEHFEGKGLDGVAYYCALRESFPDRKDMSACMQSWQFTWSGLRVACDEDTLISKYPNRGPSIVLDCLSGAENA
jgi:hypothetical protein